MFSRISPGLLRRTMSVVVAAGCLAGLGGCPGSDQTGDVSGTVRSAAVQPGIDWNPKPIELPKAKVVEWTPADKLHVEAGPVWPGVSSPSEHLAFTLQGDAMLAVLANGECHLLDPKTGESRAHWSTEAKSKVVDLAITMDGNRVVLLHEQEPALAVHELLSGKLVRTVDRAGAKITSIAVAADPSLLAIGDEAGKLQVWDVDTGKMLHEGTIAEQPVPVTAMAFANDCWRLYAADAESATIGVFELPELTRTGTMPMSSDVPVRLVPTWGGAAIMALCANRVVELITTPAPGSAPYQTVGGAAMRRGGLANCFPLPGSNQVCCYLGGTAFDYYGLPSGGTEGSASSEQAPSERVALSPDETTAATALDDGRVQFYRLPGPGKSLAVEQREFAERLRSALEAEDYDELDRLANEAILQNELDRSRRSPAMTAYFALGDPESASDENWQAWVAGLQKWLDAKPKSPAAHVMLANAHNGYGWFLRGSALAMETTQQQFQGLNDQLVQADELLAAAEKLGNPSAVSYAIWMSVSLGLNKPHAEILGLWEKGLEVGPELSLLHQAAVRAFLPRWGGRTGDVVKLADRARAKLDPELGLFCYGLIAESYLVNETAAGLAQEGFDLEVVDESAQFMLRSYPESRVSHNLAAVVAVARANHAAAADRMRLIAGGANEQMWAGRGIYERFCRWSRGKHVAADDAHQWLGSWKGLHQIEYAPAGTKLVTLSFDPTREIHVWDTTEDKLDLVQPLPLRTRPISMDRAGTVVMFAARTPGQRVALFDRKRFRTTALPHVDGQQPLRLSPDGSQLAVYDRAELLDVYDLAESAQQPAHTLTLERKIGALAFPNEQDVWCVMIAETDGRVRVVDEKQVDLIPPQQMRGPVIYSVAVPKSPRVVVAGASFLSVIDIAAKTTIRLLGEGADSLPEMTACVTNRAGTLLAIARQHANPEEVATPYEVEIWDLTRNKKVHVLPGNDARVYTMSFSTNDEQLATGDAYGFIRVWDLPESLRGS